MKKVFAGLLILVIIVVVIIFCLPPRPEVPQEQVTQQPEPTEIETEAGQEIVDFPEPPAGAFNRGIEVVPLRYKDVLTLSSDDIARVMRRAGFSDEKILEYGTDLHDALAHSGAAQIKVNGRLEAVFATNGDAVYISSRPRGNFIYNVKTGWVGSQ